MWRGVCSNKIGTFKFINVEVIGDESPRVTPTRQRRQRLGRRQRARNVQELLEKLDLKVSAYFLSINDISIIAFGQNFVVW